MRKIVWLLALLLTFGVIAHYFNDLSAIKACQEAAGSYHLDKDFCSQREQFRGESELTFSNFFLNHLGLMSLWILSIIAAKLSLLLGIVKSRPDTPRSKGIMLRKKLLMIDNYDSFTYNLIQYFGEISQDFEAAGGVGFETIVKRNDEINIQQIKALDPDFIVISPGPCTPYQSGISLDVITHFADKNPILGVCLGHQAMAQVYGAEVVPAEQVMHGKTSEIYHTGQGVFRDLPNPFKATRYHSLIVKADTLPDDFAVTAWTQNEQGELEYIMGIKHKNLPMEGVQFHPESILSEHGRQLLRNFVK